MILDNLANHEYKFVQLDATEQCSGSCLNGFINNTHIVDKYVSKINDLFSRTHWLETQRKEFEEVNPSYAFTEMRAFKVFKEEESFNTVHIAKPINSEVFDDALCLVKNYHGESYFNNKSQSNRLIKKIWLDKHG